jgi:hypothetical protein
LFQTKAGLCQSLWTIAFASSRGQADEPYAAQAAAAGLQTVRSVRWCRRKGCDVALIAKLPLYFAIQQLQDGMGGGYDCHSGSDGDHELLRLVGQQNARSQVEVSANNSEQMLELTGDLSPRFGVVLTSLMKLTKHGEPLKPPNERQSMRWPSTWLTVSSP